MTNCAALGVSVRKKLVGNSQKPSPRRSGDPLGGPVFKTYQELRKLSLSLSIEGLL